MRKAETTGNVIRRERLPREDLLKTGQIKVVLNRLRESSYSDLYAPYMVADLLPRFGTHYLMYLYSNVTIRSSDHPGLLLVNLPADKMTGTVRQILVHIVQYAVLQFSR